MSRKITTGQPGYQLLVANFSGGGDPSHGRNPVKIRQEFIYQHFPEIPGHGTEFGAGTIAEKTPGVRTMMGTLDYTTPLTPIPAAGTVTVVDNDFTAPSSLMLSEFELTSGEDFTVGGAVGATATNLALAISALPGFTATALGPVITIVGPPGLDGNDVNFEALYAGAVANFTLNPLDGSLASAEPFIGPPDIS